MNKYYLRITYCIIIFNLLLYKSKPVIAQNSVFVSIVDDIGKTTLLNRQDKIANKELDYVKSYGNSVSLSFGLRKEFNKICLSFNIGAGISKINQKYKGTINSLYQLPDIYVDRFYIAKTKLVYYNFPFEMAVGIFSKKRFKPTIAFGVFYSRLKSYNDRLENSVPYTKQGGYIEVEGKNYTRHTYDDNTNYKLTENAKLNFGYYSNTNFGLIGRLGSDIQMEKNILVGVGVSSSLGLLDIENKREISHTFEDQGIPTYKEVSNPWDNTINKYYYHGTAGTKVWPKREKTNSFQFGFYLSVKYIIKSKN